MVCSQEKVRNKMDRKETRESGIELLRILAMMGVVILHYNSSGMGKAFSLVQNNSVNQFCLYLFESLCICGVNIFILISGYFLSTTQKRSFCKIVELFLQVILFKAAFYFMSVVIGINSLTLKDFLYNILPNNYYVILYAALYAISPYVNIVIQKLQKEEMIRFTVLCLIVFSGWSFGVDLLENVFAVGLTGLSTIGIYGSQEGYTIVNFLVLYLVGACLKKFEDNKVKNVVMIPCTIGLLAVVFICSIGEHLLGLEKCVTWNYNNPLLILLSVGWFLIFKNMKIKSKVINELAKASFTCFLFHGAFLQFIVNEKIVNGSLIILIFHMILTSVILYLISYVVFKIYSLCTGWMLWALKPILDRVPM